MYVSNISKAINKIDYWNPIITISIISKNANRSLSVCLSVSLSI